MINHVSAHSFLLLLRHVDVFLGLTVTDFHGGCLLEQFLLLRDLVSLGDYSDFHTLFSRLLWLAIGSGAILATRHESFFLLETAVLVLLFQVHIANFHS